MQLLEWTLTKIPKVLCYRLYLLLKKLLQFCQCQADFKFNLFHTKVSSSLNSLKEDYIYCTRGKVFCHSLTMYCYYIGNILMGPAFKTEIPWGKLPIRLGQASQRYSSSYLEKCEETPRMESTVRNKSHWDPGDFPEWPHASPKGRSGPPWCAGKID